jgi:hypothetical protein
LLHFTNAFLQNGADGSGGELNRLFMAIVDLKRHTTASKICKAEIRISMPVLVESE